MIYKKPFERLEGRVLFAGDTVPPQATIGARNITEDSAGTYQFAVIYSDDNAVDPARLGNSNITVTGPNGYSANATLIRSDATGPERIVTGIYSIVPPNNNFDTSDTATYSVIMNANQVKDTSGNPVPAGSIGTFSVSVSPIDVQNSVLYLNGSASADTITLSKASNVLTATVNGTTETVDANSIQNVSIVGSAGADTISDSTNLPVSILGGSGADSITIGSGADSVMGNRGPDTIIGGTGADTIDGNRGFDNITGGSRSSVLNGGRGTDMITAGSASDTIYTGFGADTVFAHDSIGDSIQGAGSQYGSVVHADASLDTVVSVGSVLNS